MSDQPVQQNKPIQPLPPPDNGCHDAHYSEHDPHGSGGARGDAWRQQQAVLQSDTAKE